LLMAAPNRTGAGEQIAAMQRDTEQLGEYFVYVVKTDSNKVTQQRVSVGKQISQNVIIKEGLKGGETIVTEGVQNLREGSAIAVKGKGEEVSKAAKPK